jgi:hypothetical protein
MIADAMTFNSGGEGCTESLWNEEDGFYYDAIDWGNGNVQQLPVRSLVGLMPLYATLTLEPGVIHRFPGFKKRMDWFLKNRSDISLRNIANMAAPGKAERRLLALASKDRLRRILSRMLDEKEFLSPHGIRSCVPLGSRSEADVWQHVAVSSRAPILHARQRRGIYGAVLAWRLQVLVRSLWLLTAVPNGVVPTACSGKLSMKPGRLVINSSPAEIAIGVDRSGWLRHQS